MDLRKIFMTLSLLLLLTGAASGIERIEQSKTAVFGSSKDKAVKGHVISTHDVSSPFDCSFLCTAHTQCLSYNYKPQGAGDEGVCELNDVTMKSNPVSYQDDERYIHYYDEDVESSKSCFDYLQNGARENGLYTITDSSGESYKVWCDLTSEPGSAWTLIFSFALKNKKMVEFDSKSFNISAPVQENAPNWEAYRLSKERMQRLVSQSTHFRVTSSTPIYGVDFRDYLRAKLSNLNILTLQGNELCTKVEYIDIRGHKGVDLTVPFWQPNGEMFHTDSSSYMCTFEYDPRNGSVDSENNFGSLRDGEYNTAFRGSENNGSTTEYWFGRYMAK